MPRKLKQSVKDTLVGSAEITGDIIGTGAEMTGAVVGGTMHGVRRAVYQAVKDRPTRK